MIMSDLALINDYLLFELKALPAECFTTNMITFKSYHIHPQISNCPDCPDMLTDNILRKYIYFLDSSQLGRLYWILRSIDKDCNDRRFWNCCVILPVLDVGFDVDDSRSMIQRLKHTRNEVDWDSRLADLVVSIPEAFSISPLWRDNLKVFDAESFAKLHPDHPQLWYTFFDCNIATSRVMDLYTFHFIREAREKVDNLNPNVGYYRLLEDPKLIKDPGLDIEGDIELLRLQEAQMLDSIVNDVFDDLSFSDEGRFFDEKEQEDSFDTVEDIFNENGDVGLSGVVSGPTGLPTDVRTEDDLLGMKLPKSPEDLLIEEEECNYLYDCIAKDEEERAIGVMLVEEAIENEVRELSWWEKAQISLIAVKDKAQLSFSSAKTVVATEFTRVAEDTSFRVTTYVNQLNYDVSQLVAEVKTSVEDELDVVSTGLENAANRVRTTFVPVVDAVEGIIEKQIDVAAACIRCGGTRGRCACRIQNFTNGNPDGSVLAEHISHAVKFTENSIAPVSVLNGLIDHSTQELGDLVRHNVVNYENALHLVSEPRIPVPRVPDPNPFHVDDYIIQPHKWAPPTVGITDEQLSYVTEPFRKVIYNLNRSPDIQAKIDFVRALTRDFQPIFVTCQRVSVIPLVVANRDQDMRPINMSSSKVTVRAETLEKFMVTTTSIRIINQVFATMVMADQILKNLTEGAVVNLDNVCEIITSTVELVSCPAICIQAANSKVMAMNSTSDVVRRNMEIAVNNMTGVNLPAGTAYSDGRAVYDDSISMLFHTRECRKWFRYGPDHFPRL